MPLKKKKKKKTKSFLLNYEIVLKMFHIFNKPVSEKKITKAEFLFVSILRLLRSFSAIAYDAIRRVEDYTVAVQYEQCIYESWCCIEAECCESPFENNTRPVDVMPSWGTNDVVAAAARPLLLLCVCLGLTNEQTRRGSHDETERTAPIADFRTVKRQ